MSILRFQLLPHAYQVALRIMKKRVSTEVANLHHGHHLCATSLLHSRHQGLYGINPNDDDCSLGLRVSLRDAAIDGAWTRSHVLARRTGRDEREVELGIGRKLPAESLLVKRLARSESSAGTSK